MNDCIQVRKACVHNLKGFDLDIPRNQLVVFCGVSGSGKSSLVFDTLYTEAQRQLIETFSTFARRRLPKLSRPDVDEIRNLGTGIVIDQKRLGRTLRSTVGTATEVYTYLRLLFSRCAKPFIGFSHVFSFNHPEGMCPECVGLGRRIRVDADLMLDRTKSLKEGAITHPDFKVGGYYWRDYTSNGLFDSDKKLADYTPEELDTLLYAKDIEIRRTHEGVAFSKKWEGIIRRLERLYINKAEDELPEIRKGAYQRYLVYGDCTTCGGKRLNPKALQPTLRGRNISELCQLELTELEEYLTQIDDDISRPLVRKMRSILGHLIGIGVGYLTLSRAVATLSGGESQRVKMARQLDCDLTGLMYVLDEPSIGLHPRDIDQLVALLCCLRDKGNTVLVVEHDLAVIRAADHVIEIGPRAGRAGGQVCFVGTVAALDVADCPTGAMIRRSRPSALVRMPATLSGEEEVPASFRSPAEFSKPRTPAGWFEIKGANAHNLKNLDIRIPKGVLCCITGVAGSGKSSLVHEVLVKQQPAVVIDQGAVTRNSRSNPLTYTGIFDAVRKGFATATEKPASLFSFNSEGACPECKGQGQLHLEMGFMDDISYPCPQCEGKRYTAEVLALRWNGKNINDILLMTAHEALEFFANPQIRSQLTLLEKVGLGYLELGQSLSTLSGGETQRLKLAGELGKKGELHVMDEPTTGLHLSDIERLMSIVEELVNAGNSVVIIEHNLEVIRRADWLIDLGPEGGRRGGQVVAQGTPEDVAACPASLTGRYLKALLTRAALITMTGEKAISYQSVAGRANGG